MNTFYRFQYILFEESAKLEKRAYFKKYQLNLMNESEKQPRISVDGMSCVSAFSAQNCWKSKDEAKNKTYQTKERNKSCKSRRV